MLRSTVPTDLDALLARANPLLPALLQRLGTSGRALGPALLQALLDPRHPWRHGARRLTGGGLLRTRRRLLRWSLIGVSSEEMHQLASSTSDDGLPLPESLLGLPLLARPQDRLNWQWHAWLQQLPWSPTWSSPGQRNLLLNLQPLPLLPGAGEVLQWRRRHIAVLDPDPERVAVLRALGVHAYRLRPATTARNPWLQGDQLTVEAALLLGLPDPAALDPGRLLVLGSAGEAWEQIVPSDLHTLPRFDQLLLESEAEARALAAWLNRCQQLGHQLVRLEPTRAEQTGRGFSALEHPSAEAASRDWLPAQAFQAPLHPASLHSELTWRRAGGPPPGPIHTPTPARDLIWSWGDGNESSGANAELAITISLHNYAGRIRTALESVAQQRLETLELIVVDDASSDDGLRVVQQWLDQHGQQFQRALLLRHSNNSGLAAARNSGFAAARAPWVFVLDADNRLLPDAAAACLQVARQAPERTAMVHPLVAVDQEDGVVSHGALLGGISWQAQQFLRFNQVDAMALIRRSAWEAVGGFEHIPGGWEDYDFWCKLIAAGYSGVLCPRRLAVYTSHGDSMMATRTLQQLRPISRILQARHPWLQLTHGQGLAEGWGAMQ